MLVGLLVGAIFQEKCLVVSNKAEDMHTPAIPLLGIDPSEMYADVHQEICTTLFTAAVFIISPNWKPSKHLSMVK